MPLSLYPLCIIILPHEISWESIYYSVITESKMKMKFSAEQKRNFTL